MHPVLEADTCFSRVRCAGMCSESEFTFGFCVRLSTHVPCLAGRYIFFPGEVCYSVL